MTTLGLVSTSGQSPPTATPAGLQVRLEDLLASPRRLWLRGRVCGLAQLNAPAASQRRWWEPWRRSAAPPAPLPPLHLVTRISGSVLEADLLLDAHGRFEAQLEVNLPPARRGWRVARNHLTLGEQQCDVCNLVLTPPEGVTGALAVVLPPALTLQSGALQAPVNAALTASLGRQLQHAEQTAKRPPHVYYLACVPTESDGRAAEMALAATALGWPAGTFVLLPVDGLGPAAALERGLERLRWLYEGSGELQAMRAEAEPAGPAAALKSAFRSAGAAMRSRALGRPTRARLMVRHPVVFCHGMLAFSMLKMSIPEDCNCFSPMRKYMCERGLRALYPQVAPTSGIAERAAQLRDQILHWTDEPVNIIAHSMGGLDARYLIARLGMADHVKSLTTISTPHRGTYLADWILDNFHQRLPLLLALESFGVNIDGFRDCRLAACAAFNEKTPNHPDVRYFSYGASVPLSKLTPVLRRAWNLLKAVEGDNDGMVSVASARWGEYLGTICADHYAQTPDLTFTRPGEDFDVLGFYARLVEDLARRGF